MSTNSRPSRSRYSSPLHLTNSPSSHNRGLVEKGQRSFMQRWLEPPVQNKPSFQEAGLVRGGVVENMAALGTLPRAASVKKSATPSETTPAPSVKIVLKKPDAGASVDTPPPSSRLSPGLESAELAPESSPRPIIRLKDLEDQDDDDYVPGKATRSRRSTAANNASTPSIRLQSGRRRRKSSARPSTPSTPVNPPVLTFRPPDSTRSKKVEDRDLADKVVQEAVDEALRHYRYPTAWALRLLYDENQSDPRFVAMIEDIYHQRADIETQQEFARLVSEKKREGKKENKGCYYFVPPSTGSRFTPHKPEPAPYGNLLVMDLDKYDDEDDDDDEGEMDGEEEEEEEEADAHISKKIRLENGPQQAGKKGLNGVKTLKVTPRKSPHKATGKSPGKRSASSRKTRSGSISSSSSLSSVPDIPDDFDEDEYMGQVGEEMSPGVSDAVQSRPSGGEPNNAPTPAASTQPISATHKRPASKKKGISPEPSHSQNTTQNHHLPHDSSMPAAIITTNGASHPHKTPASIKFNSKFGTVDESDRLFKDKLLRKARTKNLTETASSESFARRAAQEPPLLSGTSDGEEGDEPTLVRAEAPRKSRTPALSSRAARAAKRKNHDELDEPVSPTALSFEADVEPPSSARDSRAATPLNTRSAKKPRGGPRIKTSPMKKKGTAAGIPRGSGERPSPVANGTSQNQDDNDDSCYACGGNGELVCCDGCNYSFHLLCIDPPMDESNMPEEWFCNECKYKFWPGASVQRPGPFGALLNNLNRKNPRAFGLPEDIREYFEGVKTGPDGEYEELVQAKPKTVKKGGAEEVFDYWKVRSADDEAVLCHSCHQTATENRLIIPCSVCGLNWHLECLDPPLAQPPPLRNWRCPCHIDDVMNHVPSALGPAHRARRIKKAPVIKQSYSRGLANNGWIEIDPDEDEDGDKAGEDWRDRKGYGRVYRLPEKGIKLDFISRVRENRSQTPSAPSYPAHPIPLSAHSLEEQQAALNLASLMRGEGDGVDRLIQALISQANPTAVTMMAQSDLGSVATGPLAQLDIRTLEAILAQADALKKGIAQILDSQQGATQPQEDKSDGMDAIPTPATPTSTTQALINSSGTTLLDDDESAMQVD